MKRAQARFKAVCSIARFGVMIARTSGCNYSALTPISLTTFRQRQEVGNQPLAQVIEYGKYLRSVVRCAGNGAYCRVENENLGFQKVKGVVSWHYTSGSESSNE